jgi:hypothetical protein
VHKLRGEDEQGHDAIHPSQSKRGGAVETEAFDDKDLLVEVECNSGEAYDQ